MFIKYKCPVCVGVHTIETGAEEAVKVLGEISLKAVSAFASSVVKALSADTKGILKEGRSKGVTWEISARELKKAVNELMERNPKSTLDRIPGVEAASPKMLGALVVEHVDGERSFLVAESGSPNIFTGGDEVFNGWRVANVYIQDKLSSLFMTRAIEREAYLPEMSAEDFTTNCAAMKLLLAVAKDRERVRESRNDLRYLKSDSPIKSLDLSEELYRPPGVKITEGFKKYTSSYDPHSETKELKEDFLLGRDEDMEMEKEHFARPCDRCRFKVPAIICPVENLSKQTVSKEALAFVS
jgi:hypothetical protein